MLARSRALDRFRQLRRENGKTELVEVVATAAPCGSFPGAAEVWKSSHLQASVLQLPALHRIRANGGDCREGISQLKAAALEYRDTKVRARYIKELDDLVK